jgi:hypothetical protein
MPKLQFFDNNGIPLNGGWVFTYHPGTVADKDTYSDNTGLVPNPNPIPLDSAGRALTTNIWLDGFYAVYLYDALFNLIWSVDNVSSMPSSGFYDAQWIPQPLVYSWINTTQFSTPGDYTTLFRPGLRIRATVTAGLIYGTVTASAFGAGITTVTCIWDAGVLDVGLSAVATGIITSLPETNSMPITIVTISTINVVFVPSDMNKIWIANKATAISFTLPLPADVPPGGWFKFINRGVGALTVVGTVSGNVDPLLNQYDEITVVSDGTLWHGDVNQARPIELSNTGAGAATALDMGTVMTDERYLVVVFASLGWAGTRPNYSYTLTAKSAGAATVLWNSAAVSSSELFPLGLSPGSVYTTKADVLKVTVGGTLTITNTITAVGGGPMGVTTYVNDVYAYRLKHLE